MSTAFDRDMLLAAFDRIGAEASRHGAVLHIAVYGGSALILASNFRFSSEDVDIAALPEPRPAWFEAVVKSIGDQNGWSPDWLNDAVSVHLSPLASRAHDHIEFSSFPRGQTSPGLVVYVPTAEYMLALKLKASRVLDPLKGKHEIADIRNLMKVVGVETGDAAVAVLAKYFPRSAADPAKLLFLLKHVVAPEGSADAPDTLAETIERIRRGEPREKAFAEFLDHFYGLAEPRQRSEALVGEPALVGDVRLDALAGAVAEYLAKRYGADIPGWASGPGRTLNEPWFTTERPGPGINEYLWHTSPAEFRSRNIFTEGLPLRRASQRNAAG